MIRSARKHAVPNLVQIRTRQLLEEICRFSTIILFIYAFSLISPEDPRLWICANSQQRLLADLIIRENFLAIGLGVLIL